MVRLKNAKEMARESCYITIKESMKEIGKMTKDMAEAMRNSKMEMFIRVITSMVELMVREYSHGLMERFMMENGVKESKKVMVYGEELTETHISANGNKAKLMVTECISGKTVTGMRESGELA